MKKKLFYKLNLSKLLYMAAFLTGLSSISTNIAQAGVQSSLINLQQDFITKYGDTSADYNQLDQLGNMNNQGIILGVFIMAIIFAIIGFAVSKSYENSTLGSMLYYVGWFFAIVAICAMGYGSVLYFFFYLPQWYKWFGDLDADGKKELMSISALTKVDNNIRNNNNNRNNSGFNINF